MSDLIVQSILSDTSFTQTEKEWIVKFNEEVKRRIQLHGINYGITMFSIADVINLDLTSIHKEGPLMFALWVTLLAHFKDYVKLEDMKYPTFDSFRQNYEGWFQQETENELITLWQIANWMNILFKMITARKNKGLAMQVIPKLIEGWEVKYVTGSGQTRFTANRVHIFEFEGNVKANHRCKAGSKKNQGKSRSAPGQVSKKDLAGMIPKRRRRTKKRSTLPHDSDEDEDGDHHDDDDEDYRYDGSTTEETVQYYYNYNPDPNSIFVANAHNHQQYGSSDDEMIESHSDLEDGEGDSSSPVNEEIKEVYNYFASQYQRDESTYSDMDLVRDISNMTVQDGNNGIAASLPVVKREISWREISFQTYTNTNSNAFMNNSSSIPDFDAFTHQYPQFQVSDSINNSPNLPAPAINEIFYGYHM